MMQRVFLFLFFSMFAMFQVDAATKNPTKAMTLTKTPTAVMTKAPTKKVTEKPTKKV
jgi:hypothetical protein